MPALTLWIFALTTISYVAADTQEGICAHGTFAYRSWNDPLHDPSNWPMLCRTGQSQSPINIRSTVGVRINRGTEGLKFYGYDSVSLFYYVIANNGHSVQVTLSAGESPNIGIKLDGVRYDLQQFHFHWPSEHKIASHRFRLEMHLVHKNAVDGRLAVVAQLFDFGDATNEGLATLIPLFADVIEPAQLTPPRRPQLRLNKFVNIENPPYFRYNGSLTTPPCTEGVQWVVLADTSTITREDYRLRFENLSRCDTTKNHVQHDEGMRLLERGNYRPTQPLFDRPVNLVVQK